MRDDELLLEDMLVEIEVDDPVFAAELNERLYGVPFDPAAEFLLTLRFDNLFDPVGGRGGMYWRCKGCRAEVRHADRQKHHAAHRQSRVVKADPRPYPDTADSPTTTGGEANMPTATRTRSTSKSAQTRQAREAQVEKKGAQVAAKTTAKAAAAPAKDTAAPAKAATAKATNKAQDGLAAELYAHLMKSIGAIKGVTKTATKSYTRFSVGSKTIGSVRALPKRQGHVQVSMPRDDGPGVVELKATTQAEADAILKRVQARAEALKK